MNSIPCDVIPLDYQETDTDLTEKPADFNNMAETIYQCFLKTVTKYPDKTALMYKKQGEYINIVYEELRTQVEAVTAGMQKLGIGKGDTVGIFSYNRPEWIIADLAILKIGGIVVPIYHGLPPSLVKYIINDSKIKLLFIENSKQLHFINKIRGETSNLTNVVLFDHSGNERDFVTFDLLKKIKYGETNKDISPILSKDTATIAYTSGTTGEPKGVILTHGNIISNALSAINRFNVSYKDVIFSYLPLSHMLERTCGHYAVIFAGGSIGYAGDLSTISEDIVKVRPTLLLAVPRVIEKAYNTALAKVEKSSPFKKALIFSAVKNLNEYANLKYKKMQIPHWLKIKRIIYNAFISSKFKKIAGGKLRLIVSGSAPLNRQIRKIIYILGFNIIEGYGLTETSPVVCSNTAEENRLGTVGKPFDGVKVKIGEDNEILVKGPNVMRGYLNKPEETERVIDNNGWLHTGDQGRFDEHGYLIITGRIKEIIVTSYGKKIYPATIEAKIVQSRYIEQVMLYGNERKCIVALVVPDRKYIKDYALNMDIKFNSYSELLGIETIKECIRQEIEKVTDDLAPYEKLKTFALLSKSFTVENGMLTSTQKLRRDEIVKKYAKLLDSLYENL
ncbi:MAG: AMP-dependent synthetase/ligase, partial [Nitrospirota bacterium]|nr:AMP-dependent synthetase/ligase [Nitrospirota bacterium]